MSVFVDVFACLVVFKIVLAQLLAALFLYKLCVGLASLLLEALILINLLRITLSVIDRPGMSLAVVVLLIQLIVIDDDRFDTRHTEEIVTLALVL